MSGTSGLIGGALGLAVLETLLSTGTADQQSGAQRLSSLFGFPAAVARWVIDPTIPGLPDRTAPPSTDGGTFTLLPPTATTTPGDTVTIAPPAAPPAPPVPSYSA